MVVNRSFCLISHTAGQQSLHYPDNTTTHAHTHITYKHKLSLTLSWTHTLAPRLYEALTAACRESAGLFVCLSVYCPACPSPAAKVSYVGKNLHIYEPVKPRAAEWLGLCTYNVKAKIWLTHFNPIKAVISLTWHQVYLAKKSNVTN